jgi:hypothetical protein
MIKKIICHLFGHKDILLTKIDNSYSIYGHYKCQRCGREENYQYYYIIT